MTNCILNMQQRQDLFLILITRTIMMMMITAFYYGINNNKKKDRTTINLFAGFQMISKIFFLARKTKFPELESKN